MAFDFPSSPSIGQVYVTGTGTAYKWTGDVWNVDAALTPLPTSRRVVNYTGAGTYSYVKPSGLKELTIELWGAGGGSGGVPLTGAGQQAVAAGGGAGGYTRKLYKASDLGASEALVLGAGGVAGAAGGAGGAGGNSTFKSLAASGGAGGAAGIASGVFSGYGLTGAGTGTGGDFNGAGTMAAYGGPFFQGTIYLQTSAGGVAFGKGDTQGSVSLGSASAGSVGGTGALGCGGHGSFNGQSVAAKAGAAGGDAFAILTETYWDADYLGTANLLSGIITRVYTTVGSTLWTKPEGLKYLHVEGVGSGGSGGGSPVLAAGFSNAGAGGGAGGYCKAMFVAADLPATSNVVIGAGGAGVAAGGNPGVLSSFHNINITGGNGGPSTGGVATLTSVAGGDGGTAFVGGVPMGVGGAGLGAMGRLSATHSHVGGGGNTPYGTGGRSYATSGLIAGEPGRGFGSGGGGGHTRETQGAVNGGAGAPGMWILTEYY